MIIFRWIVRFNIIKNFKNYIFSTICNKPYNWHVDNHSWEIVDKINKASEILNVFNTTTFRYVQFVVWCLVSLFSIFFISWFIAGFTIILWISICVIIYKFDKLLVIKYEKIYLMQHKVSTLLYDYISNIKTLISLRFEKQSQEKLLNKIEEIGSDYLQNEKLSEKKAFVTENILKIYTYSAIAIYCIMEIKNWNVIIVWNIVILYQYLQTIWDLFDNFGDYYNDIVRMWTEFNTIKYLTSNDSWIINSNKLDKNISKIDILNLKFENNTSQNKHFLKNINLRLEKWKKVALIWHSWSWKSTLLSVLRGLYIPNSVEVVIDNKKYDDLNSINSVSTFIPQDPEIFENTIWFNIGFWIKNKEEILLKYAKLSCFETVLNKLPNWFDTDIKERWVNLSWWEKQRLALARWLLVAEDSEIILLDEATSSVDKKTESLIYDNIFDYYKDKIIVASTHNLNILNKFDYVYVLKNWEIIDEWIPGSISVG